MDIMTLSHTQAFQAPPLAPPLGLAVARICSSSLIPRPSWYLLKNNFSFSFFSGCREGLEIKLLGINTVAVIQ